jgi:hypothetical protein|tara:strand:+ start:1928 stop:2221 length:294 start_codon:yes stop_codon:yes gene_type:complete
VSLRTAILTASVLVLATASPGLMAAERVDDATAKRAVTEYNKNAEERKKVVCKRVRQTGSHFKTRLCRTREQWDDMRATAQDQADKLSRGTTGNTGS